MSDSSLFHVSCFDASTAPARITIERVFELALSIKPAIYLPLAPAVYLVFLARLSKASRTNSPKAT